MSWLGVWRESARARQVALRYNRKISQVFRTGTRLRLSSGSASHRDRWKALTLSLPALRYRRSPLLPLAFATPGRAHLSQSRSPSLLKGEENSSRNVGGTTPDPA